MKIGNLQIELKVSKYRKGNKRLIIHPSKPAKIVRKQPRKRKQEKQPNKFVGLIKGLHNENTAKNENLSPEPLKLKNPLKTMGEGNLASFKSWLSKKMLEEGIILTDVTWAEYCIKDSFYSCARTIPKQKYSCSPLLRGYCSFVDVVNAWQIEMEHRKREPMFYMPRYEIIDLRDWVQKQLDKKALTIEGTDNSRKEIIAFLAANTPILCGKEKNCLSEILGYDGFDSLLEAWRSGKTTKRRKAA